MQRGTIIWDWNGTLLNDLNLCITTINTVLQKRSLPILDKNKYLKVFSFPVKEYYKSIGFNFREEEFSIPANEFIELYESGVSKCALHPMAENVLFFFKEAGYRQFVLSAMHHEMLQSTLQMNGILEFFEGIAGLNDHYAASKIQRGEWLIKEYNIKKENSWLVGDTIHDYEVAQELKVGCILIADGHQSEERLKSTGSIVLKNLETLLNLDLSNLAK